MYRVVDNSGERSSGRDSDSVINGVSPGRDDQNSAALRLVETIYAWMSFRIADQQNTL